MSKPEDQDPEGSEDRSPEDRGCASKGPHSKKAEQTPSAGMPGTEKRSGRVAFDARGNPIWEWQLETGVYSRDVSTQKLQKLDLGDLSIAETASHKQPPGLDESGPGKPGPDRQGPDKHGQARKAPMPGGGFNPYDNSSQPVEGSNHYDNARALGKKSGPVSPAPPPERKPADLKKLDAWMKLKKKLLNRKDED